MADLEHILIEMLIEKVDLGNKTMINNKEVRVNGLPRAKETYA